MSDSTASATAALAAISSPSPSIGFTRLPSLEVLVKQLPRDDLLKSIAGTLIMEAVGIYAKAGDTETSDVLGVSVRTSRVSTTGKAPEKHVDHWIYLLIDDGAKLIIDGVSNGHEPSDLTQALRGYIILIPALNGRTFGAEIKAANLAKGENLLAVTNVAFWEATRKQPVMFRDGGKAPVAVFSAQKIRDLAQPTQPKTKKRSADGTLCLSMPSMPSMPLKNKNDRFDAVVAGLKRAIGDDELVNMALTYGEPNPTPVPPAALAATATGESPAKRSHTAKN